MKQIKALTVLSLFDGMSCGQIALERAGIPIKAYYASEIDKYAIAVTQKNYPNTVQLGDIQNWKSWDIPVPDLIIAGSPCQGFSNAGHGLNFEDPRSKLFFVFCDILAVYAGRNPNLKYLLENVKMKQEWRDIITDRMKLKPILINSALVSAQNRERLYWMNWEVNHPEDKHIYLKDIIEHGEVDREKSYTIDANYFKGGNPRSYFEDGRIQVAFAHQSHKRAMVKIGRMVGRRINENGKRDDYNYALELKQRIEITRTDGKSGTLSTVHKDNLLIDNDFRYRKLTVLECERLQTVPEGYTEGVSNTQRYKMLGNGWTIDVIAHIFSHLNLR